MNKPNTIEVLGFLLQIGLELLAVLYKFLKVFSYYSNSKYMSSISLF